jgi:predicted dehydrogenase
MKDTAFRVGIVGCGYGAQVLTPAFRSDPRVRVVAISAQSQAKAQESAQALAVAEAFGEWRDMLDPDRTDAVAIATPPNAQPEIALVALGRGLAVFAEKPLALSIDAGQAMVHAAEASGRANMIDFNFREIAAFRAAYDQLRSGALGPVHHVAVTWHVESYANRARLQSWKTDVDSGGGALSNFVSHSLDYLEWMLGPIASLGASLAGMSGDVRQNDTFVGLMMRFKSGAAGGLMMSAAAYRGSGHRIEIYGEEGSLILENPGPDYMRGFRFLFARRPDALAPVEVPKSEDAWRDGRVLPASRLAKRFTDWALGGEPCEPSFAAGLRVQTLIEAARESSKTGAWIDTSATGPC